MPIMSRGTEGHRLAPRLTIDTSGTGDGDGRSAGTATIRVSLDATAPERLDALRTVRRAMIREEWTRGLDEGEPSLLDADFSRAGILWDLPLGQIDRGRAKLGALVRRANMLLKPERDAARAAEWEARIQ
jgi:hypothetical protein